MGTVIFRLLRISSTVICVLLLLSFLVFAVDQTKEGSLHQQQEITSPATVAAASSSAAATGHKSSAVDHEGTLHKALTDTFNKLTAPFAGVVSSSSEWATRGIKLLLALLVYGFGLGYLARVLRVRT